MTPVSFVTDASLAPLARRLRQLGYDVLVHSGARLEELFAAAGTDGRVVLTRSARHPNRWASVPALRIDTADLAGQVRMAIAIGPASSPPLGRCTHCNHVLRSRSAFEAHGEVPGRVARSGSPLSCCTGCGQWFWLGSHTERLRQWFTAAVGPVDGWPDGPPQSPAGHMPRQTR